MSANDYQHGGSHYGKALYQHWDFVTDLNLPYLLGCATKYITRWRDKNGLEDLNKADHYLQKSAERGFSWLCHCAPARLVDLDRFTSQLPSAEGLAVRAAVIGDLQRARELVAALIAEAA